MGEYAGGDRRPIASRNLRVFQIIAEALARAGVSANAISVAGMLVGIAAGALLMLTARAGDTLAGRLLFAAAAGGIQLRLLANMLDGMVAIAAGKASPVGELYNELPDRVSDTAILVGAGYAATGNAMLGWAAACVALLVTYVRALGKGLGVPGLFQGPMAKAHRMFLLTVTCGILAVAPGSWGITFTWNGERGGAMAIALLIVGVGGILTALRRLAALVAGLRKDPGGGGSAG